MVVLALRGGWIPAFAGMTTGENESGRNGGNDTGKESSYKCEVHPLLTGIHVSALNLSTRGSLLSIAKVRFSDLLTGRC